MKITNKNAFSFFLKIDNFVLLPQKSSKYLRVSLDSKTSFHSHISKLCSEFRLHLGILPKVKLYVPEDALIRYYNSKIESVLYYVLLFYGCCSPIVQLFLSEVLINQRKVLFSYARTGRNLRLSNDLHLVVPRALSRPHKYSLMYRGAKLFNLSVNNRMVPGEISLISNQFDNLEHRLEDLCVQGNSELLNYIYDC